MEKQRYQDAAGAYRAFVNRDPDNVHAPDLAMQAIEAYTKGGFTDLVIDGKREYASTTTSRAVLEGAQPRGLSEGREGAEDQPQGSGHVLSRGCAEVEAPADYQQAAHWYRSYLNSFPEDADSAATNYLLADALFESHQYGEAATEYEHTAYGYPKNAKSAAAAYAALVSYQKGEESLTGAEKSAWHKRAIDAGIKFAQTFPEHPDSGGVLTRAAEDIFASRRSAALHPGLPAAAGAPAAGGCGQAAHRLDHHRPVPVRPRRLCQGGAGVHPGARPRPATDVKMRADLTERIAATVYSQGEAKQKAGDCGRRGGGFPARREGGAGFQDPRHRPVRCRGAAHQSEAMGPAPSRVLEAFRQQFPQSPLQRT